MSRSALVFASAFLLAGCPANPARPDSGGEDGAIEIDGGVSGGLCGGAGADCCAGRICELGLRCGRGDTCCVQPGSSAACDSASDCCQGLACQGSRCCTPRAAACSASSDCCMGLVCSREGTCEAPGDVDPTMPSCGTPGMVCCAGFSCRDEAVCNTESGTCELCGQEGQPCCDGASPCTSTSLSCEVARGAGGEVVATCVDPMDPSRLCGGIDEPCCMGTTGMATDCSGGLTCSPSGTCLNPTDTGMMGEPCGPRG